jgi:hypothetical protein
MTEWWTEEDVERQRRALEAAYDEDVRQRRALEAAYDEDVPDEDNDAFWTRLALRSLATMPDPRPRAEAFEKMREALWAFLDHRSRVFNAQMRGKLSEISSGAIDTILDQMREALAAADKAEPATLKEDENAK